MNKEDKERCGLEKTPSFERNNYYFGKLLTARDFFLEQCYFNEKRWLINRMILGWGVVCGLEVELVDAVSKRIKIKPGLAIDCCGHEIAVCEAVEKEIRLSEEECEQNQALQKPEDIYVGLQYWECKTEEVAIAPAACKEEDKCEFNRIRDYYKICFLKPSQVDLTPEQQFCPLEEHVSQDLRQYICEKLKAGCPQCPEKPRNHAVILAKIILTENGSIEKMINCDEHRRSVYGNKTLFDLINCYHGDLPKITKISWEHGKTKEWNEFLTLIHREKEEFSESDGLAFSVSFDRNVTGVDNNTILLMVDYPSSEDGYIHSWRVPIIVKYIQTECKAIFRVTKDWYDDIKSISFIKKSGATFRVIILGDFIFENNKSKKSLDANFNGSDFPTGNGTPGGVFLSWFSVKPIETKERPGKTAKR